MGKSLASKIACCYLELQKLRNLPINNFPPGSLVNYFDQQHEHFICNLVTKYDFSTNLDTKHQSRAAKR